MSEEKLTLEEIKELLEQIDDKLYSINSTIALRWIGMKQTPTDKEIFSLNEILGDIIKELRKLREANWLGEK